MSEQSTYQLKQFSDIFTKKVVTDYLYLTNTSGAYERAIDSCGGQVFFESTFLNGGSSDKIASHYRYFKDITNYIRSATSFDICKMDVYDLLHVLERSSRRIKLDSFVNNIFIRYYNIKLLNDLYYLCEGASISFSEYCDRFVELYISMYGEDTYEDCQSFVDDFMSTTHSLLYTFSKRVDEVFSDETFESACVFGKKMYLTTNLRLLCSDKYQSKGVLVIDCIKFYYDILERAKKNAFTMDMYENIDDLYQYIKEYTSSSGAKCLSTNRTIQQFLETMFDYFGLVSRYEEFAEYIIDGADFETLDKVFKLHKYGISDVDVLVSIINSDLIWIAVELPDNYKDFICNEPYGCCDFSDETEEISTDEDDEVEDILGDNDVYVTSDGALAHYGTSNEIEEIDTDREDVVIGSIAIDFKHSDVAFGYDSTMVHSVLYAIIRGDIDVSNINDKLHIDDMFEFIKDIVRESKDIPFDCVREIVSGFVYDVISNE